MSAWTKIISFICLLCLVLCGIRLADQLPADARVYVEKKYAGWSGVLQGWVCSDWACEGGFISWLNAAAAAFERRHEGVYLEFEYVNRAALLDESLYPPDMIFFSDSAAELSGESVAMGGYVFVENPSAAGTAIPEAYAGAYLTMYARHATELAPIGLDLGLPTSSAMERIEFSDDAFRRFCNGELGRTIVNQRELGRLIALRERGLGPDWQCMVQGEYCWCDQLLKLNVCANDERSKLCAEFQKLLLSEEWQCALSNIGGFPVTDVSAYSDASPYRAMEQQLRATKPLFQKSEHSAAEIAAMVRRLEDGQISLADAQAWLLQTCN